MHPGCLSSPPPASPRMAHFIVFYVRVVASVVDSLGLFLTLWRIYFRLKIGRFWWEDTWAAVLLATGLCWIISCWTSALSKGLAAAVTAWIYSIGFTCIVTLGRMSILFSVIRIIHPRLLKFTYACVAFFVMCWLIIIVEKAYMCASDPSWLHNTSESKYPICPVDKPISIFEFTTDCIAVSILVVLPLRMLWRVKLPRRQRRMILSIFASSVVLAFGAAFHKVGQILDVHIVKSAGFHVEIALSIIVCNLLVAVTYTCRFLLHDTADTTGTTGDTSDDDDFTTWPRRPAPATTLSLTTINLEVSLTTQQSSAVSEST